MKPTRSTSPLPGKSDREPERGRPRDEELTARILSATLELVARHGYRQLTTAAVAAAAGTSKQALYRRWPGKSQLVAEAVRWALGSVNPAPPECGSLAQDLVAVLGRLATALSDTPLGGAIAALVGETADEPLSACLGAVEAERRQLLMTILERARGAGEYPSGRELAVDIDALLGGIYFRLLVRRLPPDRRFVGTLVRQWLAGVTPGAS